MYMQLENDIHNSHISKNNIKQSLSKGNEIYFFHDQFLFKALLLDWQLKKNQEKTEIIFLMLKYA